MSVILVELHLYLEVDSELATSEELTDAAIIQEVRGALLGEDLEEEKEDDTIVDAPPPSTCPYSECCHGCTQPPQDILPEQQS